MSNQQKRLIYMQCETIQIKSDDDLCLTINKDDYDENLHALFIENEPEPLVPEELKKPPKKTSK